MALLYPLDVDSLRSLLFRSCFSRMKTSYFKVFAEENLHSKLIWHSLLGLLGRARRLPPNESLFYPWTLIKRISCRNQFSWLERLACCAQVLYLYCPRQHLRTPRGGRHRAFIINSSVIACLCSNGLSYFYYIISCALSHWIGGSITSHIRLFLFMHGWTCLSVLSLLSNAVLHRFAISTGICKRTIERNLQAITRGPRLPLL